LDLLGITPLTIGGDCVTIFAPCIVDKDLVIRAGGYAFRFCFIKLKTKCALIAGWWVHSISAAVNAISGV
jgi:hypothetical protein